jgi:hypothetical protein
MKPCSLALALLALLPSKALAQEPSEDRELALLVEEQALLQRQIQRLRGTMELLLQRISLEGRTHATDLIRRALEELDQRAAEAEVAPLTLDERMDAARAALEQGRLAQSLEHQEQLVAKLERLLAILLDRENMDELEERLARLRAYDQALEDLADQEGKLREETEALHEESRSEAARELLDRLQALTASERELLRRTEEIGRASGAAELEELADELSKLLADQRTDAAVLEAWDPADLARLEAAREALAEALREEARAERLSSAAGEIRRAADPAAIANDPEAARARLAEAAERAQAQARVSGDPAAEASARALEAALAELERARREDAERAATALQAGAQALEEEAARARERAESARSEASERLSDSEGSAGAGSAAAEEVQRALEEAAKARSTGASDETRAATERANEALERARNEEARLAEALEGSQAAAAQRSRRLERGLASLEEGATPSGTEAREALDTAAEAMDSASKETRGGEPDAAARAAAEAVRALEQAQAALEQARAAAGEEGAFSELAREQQALAQELEELEELPSRASLDPGAESEVEEALDEAQRAMEQSGTELEQGRIASAAGSERRSLEALEKASASTRSGVRPSEGAGEERARELEQEQARIQKEILDLGRRIEEEDAGLDTQHLERAQAAMDRAAEALRAGDLDAAAEAQEEAERELRRQQQALDEEEERYQRLRAEELLFRLGEELAGMLATHQLQMQAVVEVDADRAGSDREEPSRSVKLRLRGIAREETGLAGRAREMAAAIEKEGARVSAQILANMASDLDRVAELVSETGDYDTSERTQALQRDVEDAFAWMIESLQAERKRREQQAGEPQQEQPAQDAGQEPLVPDSAELKLLRRMEVEIQESVDQLLALHPELRGDVEEIDPAVLRDITRLAERHESVTRLFRDMRVRLGIDAPEPETSPTPEAEGDDR